MKVLFAMGSNQWSKNISDRYYDKFGETLEYKDVFYFKALLEEVKRNKSYNVIVIHEDLEQYKTKDIEQLDRKLFSYVDSITDEAQDADIIYICSDRRTKDDPFVVRLFSIGIYNILLGDDRNVNPLCDIIKKPKNKREAKEYLNIASTSLTGTEMPRDDEVEEAQMINILNYYEKIKNQPEKYVETFERISSQYTRAQLKVIASWLPKDVQAVIYNEPKYKFLLLFDGGQQKGATSATVKPIQDVRKIEKPRSFLDKVFKTDKSKKIKEMRDKKSVSAQDKKDEFTQTKQQENKIAEQQQKLNEQQELLERAKKEAEERERKLQEQQRNNNEVVVENNLDLNKELDNKLKKEAEERERKPQEQQINNSEIVVENNLDLNKELDNKLKEEARRRAEEELRIKEEEERKQKELEASLKEEARRRAEEETRIKEEEERKQKELEASLKEEARRRAEEETRIKEEERKQKELEASLKEEARRRAEEETRIKEEQNAQVKNIINASVSTTPAMSEEQKKFKEEQEKLALEQEKIRKIQAELEEEKRKLKEEQEKLVKEKNQIDVMPAQDVKTTYETTPIVPVNYKKVVAFVGANKAGTTFMVNAVAYQLSSQKIVTSILDMTKDKGMYYIYNQNDKTIRKIASECMQRLSSGEDSYIPISRYLKVYTTIPGGISDSRRGYKHKSVIETVKDNTNVTIIDADFTTPIDYFENASEIYIVQDMDTLKIQETTMFLREMKNRNMDMSKVRIIINKYVKNLLTPKKIVEATSYYKDPEMTFIDAVLNNKVMYSVVPYNLNNYVKYTESLYKGTMSFKNYSTDFTDAITEISNQVYLKNGNAKKGRGGIFG